MAGRREDSPSVNMYDFRTENGVFPNMSIVIFLQSPVICRSTLVCLLFLMGMA